MSQIESVTAILIRAADYRDNDKLVRLFTVEGGMINAVFRGVKKPNAKLKAAAMPFAFCRYDLARRGTLYTVTGAAEIESLFAVCADPDRYTAGCVMLQVSDNAVDELVCPQLFIKLLKALKALIYSGNHPYLVCLKYVLAALDEQGYRTKCDGAGAADKLIYAVQHTALDNLSVLSFQREVLIKALRRALNECEYHFDKQVPGAKML